MLSKNLFFMFFLFWVSSFVCSELDSDKSVLLQFKDSVSDPFGILSTWNSSISNYCSWFGVSCDSNSRVVALNISGFGGQKGNSDDFVCSEFWSFSFYGFGSRKSCSATGAKLVGKLPPVLANLTELRVLSLPYNNFSGEIPVEIWTLKNLEVLDLERNSFSGNLSNRFNGFPNLRVLNLAMNGFVDEIPNLVNSVGLRVLNLAGNEFGGSIPRWVGSLSELQELYLSLNRLNGYVPVELGNNCQYLEHLDLSENFLIGSIPRNLANCSQLRTLLLFANVFDNVIPRELGQLKKLRVLDVSRNCLSGPIPAELGNLVELSVLVLANPFRFLPTYGSSSMSPGVANTYSNDYNYFQGSIPVEVTKLPQLGMIWVPGANIEGQLPMNWSSCEHLQVINLARNLFTGSIRGVFGGCKNLHFLDLSSNKLSGELDGELPVSCMTYFDVSGNSMSGPIPSYNHTACSIVASLTSAPIQFDDISSAYISFFMSRTQSQTGLPFSDNSFAVFHNFGNNNFSGEIPMLPMSTEGQGGNTEYAFLAAGNKLSGSFPGNLFGKCRGFHGMMVNVSHNDLTGHIPSDIGSLCSSLKLLDASDNQIFGSIPSSIGDLEYLVVIDLRGNELQGQIQSSIGQLSYLKSLSLSRNNLSGVIPSSLGQLHSLQVLDLSYNSFSGEIPQELEELSNLTVLLLNNNQLSGQIPPGLANDKSLSVFNASFNNLSGSLPENDSLGGASQANDESPPQTVNKKGKGFNSIEIASIVSASAIVSVLLALIVLFIYTRKRTPNSRVQVLENKELTVFTDIGVPLTYENVVLATGNFNASNCTGSGGFGATYKAEVAPGILVAVKRLFVGKFQGVEQFHTEIRTLARMRHPNLVTLIGYHASETEMFLIYNYFPGGNLENFIQERSTRAVDWVVLHKIALDIAQALAYLHDHCVPRVLHRDVKPSNILLDNDLNAYLSDFGLSRLLGASETHATTGVAGTFGYVAPEYATTCRVSEKADVYSYGVVLLELLSDKKALDPSFSSQGNGFNIVSWVCMLLRQGRGGEAFTAGLWDGGPQDTLILMLHLAIMCTDESLSTRPTMRKVVRCLRRFQPSTC